MNATEYEDDDGTLVVEFIDDRHRFIISFEKDEPFWIFVTKCGNKLDGENGKFPPKTLERLKNE